MVVVAGEDEPLFELGFLAYEFVLFLDEECEIGSAFVVGLEGVDGAIGLVADEDVDLEIVLGRVEVVEGGHFAADLHLLVLEEDVLAF